MDNKNIVSFEKHRGKTGFREKVEVTINEFEKFIKFIESEKPGLTANKEANHRFKL
ncbi:hypothetical protein [Desulfoscipio sp. XC116]|uniref:hypothetical protein n=1 Tax=Desulfoscipio sp. XC116 TaxID=3144975 RepID=UPI00325B19C9